MRDSRVEVVETGQPPVQLLACALCGVLLWDIRAHYRHAHQGAAPQAESTPKSSYISPSLPGMIRNLWRSDPSENSVRTALKLAGDLIQELIDLRAAPVLSGGVDEDALVQRIYDELMTDDAVAEVWSNGKVLATARRLVKFAVQGGESRGE